MGGTGGRDDSTERQSWVHPPILCLGGSVFGHLGVRCQMHILEVLRQYRSTPYASGVKLCYLPNSPPKHAFLTTPLFCVFWGGPPGNRHPYIKLPVRTKSLKGLLAATTKAHLSDVEERCADSIAARRGESWVPADAGGSLPCVVVRELFMLARSIIRVCFPSNL